MQDEISLYVAPLLLQSSASLSWFPLNKKYYFSREINIYEPREKVYSNSLNLRNINKILTSHPSFAL